MSFRQANAEFEPAVWNSTLYPYIDVDEMPAWRDIAPNLKQPVYRLIGPISL